MRIVILGGGPAGYAAASAAAAAGADTTLIERERPGGACTLWDAIPSKTLLDAADAISNIEHAAHVGLQFDSGRPVVDFPRMMQRAREVADYQCQGVNTRLSQERVRVVIGEGTVVDRNTVAVKRGAGETTITYDALVVATGARPWIPDFAVTDSDRVLTTRTMWHKLEQLPPELIVVGAGATGCEMSDFFQRCGSKVTLVSSRDRILPNEDVDVAWVVEDAFLMRGMKIQHRSRGAELNVTDEGVEVTLQGGATISGSHALFAVGMMSNTDGIGLENAGVKVAEKGGIQVNDQCQTNVHNIYAVGDVTGGILLANVAAMQGRHAVLHALGEPVSPIRYEAVASTVFTRPEIADVGLTETRANEDGRDVLVVSHELKNNPRAVIHGTTHGLIKLVVDSKTGVVLGGSIVGLRASELIMTVALAVRGRMNVQELAETGAVNPSVSESLQRAAERATVAFLGGDSRKRVSSVTFS